MVNLAFLAGVFALTTTQPPAALAQTGPEALRGLWTVEVIDKIPVLPESRVTIAFQGTRVSGTASCNTYQGTASVNGRNLRLSGILATMKYCDDARMRQERELLELLREATRFEIRDDGTLVIRDGGGRQLTARRATTN